MIFFAFRQGDAELRFPIYAIAISCCLFGIAYYPSLSLENPDGPEGLFYGLLIATLIMVPSYFVMRWAMGQPVKTFMIVFGVGFLVRLILFAGIFVLYWKVVKIGMYSFGLSYGVGYLALIFLEILFYKSEFSKKEKSAPSPDEG